MDKATLEFPYVRAGIILMLDRTFTPRQNEIIIGKAIKYKSRGIIGIDLAGPQHSDFHVTDYGEIFGRARKVGLGITFHTGEEGSVDEMSAVLEIIKPQRIGHGFLAAHSEEILRHLSSEGVVLELCPTSNIKLGLVKDAQEYKTIVERLKEYGIKFTINTDGPEMLETNLQEEMSWLFKHKILTKEELLQTNEWAREASFIGKNTEA